LPDSFAYIFSETGQRITEEMRQEMHTQEEIAKAILDEMDKQDRHY
jgi:aspartate oxidase